MHPTIEPWMPAPSFAYLLLSILLHGWLESAARDIAQHLLCCLWVAVHQGLRLCGLVLLHEAAVGQHVTDRGALLLLLGCLELLVHPVCRQDDVCTMSGQSEQVVLRHDGG